MRQHLRLLLCTVAAALAAACGSDPADPSSDGGAPGGGAPTIQGGGGCPVGLGCVRRTGTVNDFVTRAPLAGVRVDVLDRTNDASIMQIHTDAAGHWDTGYTIPFGTSLRIILSRDGYQTLEVAPNTLAYMVPHGYDPGPNAVVHGGIAFMNAGWVFPLQAALVEVFDGADVTGSVVATAVSDAEGRFEIGALPPGDHAIRLSAKYFIDTVRVWTLESGKSVNVGLRLVLAANVDARFTLTWNNPNRDLDLIVERRSAHGDASDVLFRVDYANPGSCNAPPFACLDADVRDASGAETIIVRNIAAQPYRVYVNNYTAYATGLGPAENSLAASGARVAFHVGGDLIASLPVPDALGRTWYVGALAAPLIQRPGFAQQFPATFAWSVK